jgi:uncharacterized membrane protein YidH (DUF202 family)
VRTLGAILIVLGFVALVWGGISYTKREKVIDVGPIEASVDKRKHIPLPPVVGVVAVLAGVIMVTRRGGVPV